MPNRNGWQHSDRRDHLPRDWPRIRRRILNRDPTCTCPGCPLHPLLCHATSTDVDHIDDRDNHNDTNLRGLCSPCHAKRSSQQGVTARRQLLAQARHPAEAHPGFVNGRGTTP